MGRDLTPGPQLQEGAGGQQGGGGHSHCLLLASPSATLPLREKPGAAGGRRNSIARMEAGEGEVVANGNTTVILVRGNTEELEMGHTAS